MAFASRPDLPGRLRQRDIFARPAPTR